MSTEIVTFSKLTPAAPTNHTNVEWQTDGLSNPHLSASVPDMTATQGGLVPTPPNDSGKFLDGTASYSYPIGGPISGTIDVGKIPIGQSNGSVVWADPVVQGVYVDGASVATPGSPGDLSTIQPVLVAGKNASGNMQSIPITTNGVKVDGSAVTQPVSAASLPLPSGASTSAKQPALGTAGTASTDVITVQGIASMTALKVDGSAVTQPVSGTVTANAGTNLNTSALALESGGNLATLAGIVASAVAKATNVQAFASSSSTPAAGANVSLTVPSGENWRLKSIAIEIVTSSTTANRQVGVKVVDGSGHELAHATSPVVVTASNDNRFIFAPSLATTTTVTNANGTVGFPELCLPTGFQIVGSMIGLQSTDVLTMFINYEKIRIA